MCKIGASFISYNFTNIASLLYSLCCTCGVPIPPNPANMCVACLRTQVDISEGIPKQVTVQFCKQCERCVSSGFFLNNVIMYRSYHCFPPEKCTSWDFNGHLPLFLQVLAASNHLDVVCPGVQGAAESVPEKSQELHVQSECNASQISDYNMFVLR